MLKMLWVTVMEAIKATKEKLNDEVPLIGFAGSPWTILCYCVQGQGSKNFDKAKELCFTQPVVAHSLLQKITDTTIAYLKAKVKAGVNAVQVFDSWGGMLSPTDYNEFSWQYIQQIIDAIKDETPVIVFGKGCWFALGDMAKSGASALGVDWTCSARNAHIKKMVTQMINEFGKDNYIVNLGHGILPNVPVENAKAFIDAVKEYQNNYGAVYESTLETLSKELLFTVLFLLLSLIPVIGIFATVLLFLTQAFYAGFGNMDYTLERHFQYKDSIQFVKKNRGIAIGNGIVFMLFLLLPVVGIILVLPLSVTAASVNTVQLLKANNPSTVIKQNLTPDLSKSFVENKVKEFAAKEEFLFVLKDKETHTVVGLIYLKELDWEKKQGELAYAIGYQLEDKFFAYIQNLQDTISAKLEEVDGKATFAEDIWKRPEGGGGRTRVIENGNVFEKGGVNISGVHGELPKSMQAYFGVEDADFLRLRIEFWFYIQRIP
ncbi:Uroporphyrinogen decarboxylase [Nymphon striatum]|nr:Uroporphyrinogen decarboxylase [Nymphon striatum]